jgi:hypothetical protein
MYYTVLNEGRIGRISKSTSIPPSEAKFLIQEMVCHFIALTYLDAIDRVLVEKRDIFLIDDFLTECSSNEIFKNFISKIERSDFKFFPQLSFKELCVLLGPNYIERYNKFELDNLEKINNLYDKLMERFLN